MARVGTGVVCAVFAAIAVGISPGGGAHGQSKNVEALYKRIQELSNAGKYADAIPLAEQLLKRYEAQLGKDNVAIAPLLYNLADLYKHQGRLSDAELLY